MEGAYKEKIRVRIQNLLGPKRHVDISSCSFMKDLSTAMQDDFKVRMQTAFRKRELRQIHRAHFIESKEEEAEEKLFFEKDWDDDWKENYSEESDEDESKDELRSETLSREQDVLTIEEIDQGDEQIGDQGQDIGDQINEPIVEMAESEEGGREPSEEMAKSDEESLVGSSTGDLKSEEDVEFDGYLRSSDESSAGEEMREGEQGEEDKESIFSYPEIFQKYKAPVVEDMEKEESIEKLFDLAETLIAEERLEVPTISVEDMVSEGGSKSEEEIKSEDGSKTEEEIKSEESKPKEGITSGDESKPDEESTSGEESKPDEKIISGEENKSNEE